MSGDGWSSEEYDGWEDAPRPVDDWYDTHCPTCDAPEPTHTPTCAVVPGSSEPARIAAEAEAAHDAAEASTYPNDPSP